MSTFSEKGNVSAVLKQHTVLTCMSQSRHYVDIEGQVLSEPDGEMLTQSNIY